LILIKAIPLSLKKSWNNASASSIKPIILVGGIILAVIVLYILPIFFNYIQRRHGITLHDWVLPYIPAYNVSVLIFMIIWGMGILAFCRAIYQPVICATYIWALILICIARIITISMFSLNPPVDLMPLTDPLTGIFYGHSNITRDLFFSGHTSTLTLIYLCLQKRYDKLLAMLALITVMVLLLIQHIHYTIDVIAAPFIVYLIFSFTRLWLKRFN
jgi:hypothetical protein